jgi:hypothetical protein
MPSSALRYASLLAAVSGSFEATANAQCPEGRTLEQQITKADAVVLGKVKVFKGGKCEANDPTCMITAPQANISVEKSWKGPINRGEVLVLSMPFQNEDLQIRNGTTVVVFARVNDSGVKGTWAGSTDACMLPSEHTSTDKDLRKKLDAWHKTQGS